MGTWGTAIFSNDTAADVRDTFRDLVADGASPADATDRLIADWGALLDDPDQAVAFWLALAATQWKLGRLLDEVRDRAIAIIDREDHLREWADSERSEIQQRKKHVAKLLEQLQSQPPAAKKLRPRKLSTTDFLAGDVAAYRLDDRTVVRFCVLTLVTDRGGTYAKICLLGIDDGAGFVRRTVPLEETFGPHYTMVTSEPRDRITLLARGVTMPPQELATWRAWNQSSVRDYVYSWEQFPDALRAVLPVLGWR